MLDQKNYTGFITEGTLDQTGSYLKVVDLVEGTESDPVLGSVKTLEVIFDLDVKLLYSNQTNDSHEGRLTGFLRMKYQEKV